MQVILFLGFHAFLENCIVLLLVFSILWRRPIHRRECETLPTVRYLNILERRLVYRDKELRTCNLFELVSAIY